jgi:nucleotide-binding universal stress UspA family protein
MAEPRFSRFLSAVQDFRRARRRAALQDVLAQLTGRPVDLLSYEEASRKLRAEGAVPRGLQEIPLDAIVGSVARYTDFTRSFLPRQDSDEERWARVKVQVTDHGGLNPIQVYQIGEAYFVADGNHRVSVARQLGASTILAHVTEVHTRVPLSPQDRPDALIWKAEYAGFLERTHLNELRPQANLSVTVPGQYRTIEEQIAYQQRLLGLLQGPVCPREIPYEEAVAHWYDEAYLPVVQVIRERGILRDFPGRTETDLYVWISEHRAALEEELGWEVLPQDAAEHLVELSSPRPQHVLTRIGERVLETVTPRRLQAGPRPGHWRQEHVAARHDDRLFRRILVAISGQEAGWRALDMALLIARREGARLQGLHVVPSEAGRKSAPVQAVRAEFQRRCQAAGIPGRMATGVGMVSQRISERGRWGDLVVLSLSCPPSSQPIARLSSGLSNLLRNCPRPIMTVPEECCRLERALLAYDGSPKAEEALFVATYLAARWRIPLVVVTVVERGRTSARTLAQARAYLEGHGVLQAAFVKEKGPVAETVLQVAEAQASDLLIMGGYGYRPVWEVMLGSAVDRLLRTSHRPMLICR